MNNAPIPLYLELRLVSQRRNASLTRVEGKQIISKLKPVN